MENQDKPKIQRNSRKERIGKVVSIAGNKSIVVLTERRVRHPKYEKTVTRSKKFMAHDENNIAGIGDTVKIMETRPLSRRKRWRLVEIIEKAK
ncbi:MAG: 30S ribosomal protein S17 [Bacteroidia bacterium]|nr:30S ribosomal protein S17 [Bacteroidia bacterium]MDW8301290.1 30S ribosomal protein S17 [Bacteroidia bacterium]